MTIDRWERTSRYPEGHFVRALGKVQSKEAEQESLLLEFDVPYRPFGKAILDCLPPEGDKWVVPPKSATDPNWRDREDLRDLIICSIDPPGVFWVPDRLGGSIDVFCSRVSRYRRRFACTATCEWQYRGGRPYVYSAATFISSP